MTAQDFLTHQFLIAMPTLGDPNFHETVTYICEHNADGALGIIINRPLTITLREVFAQLSLDVTVNESAQSPIFAGGPVQPQRGFVIHRPLGAWQATLQVTGDVGVTGSQDILVAMAQGDGPEHALFALGYAGWGAGQLEQELAANAWLNTTADADLIFSTPPADRWQAAAKLIGVDISLLSGNAGHA